MILLDLHVASGEISGRFFCVVLIDWSGVTLFSDAAFHQERALVVCASHLIAHQQSINTKTISCVHVHIEQLKLVLLKLCSISCLLLLAQNSPASGTDHLSVVLQDNSCSLAVADASGEYGYTLSVSILMTQ